MTAASGELESREREATLDAVPADLSERREALRELLTAPGGTAPERVDGIPIRTLVPGIAIAIAIAAIGSAVGQALVGLLLGLASGGLAVVAPGTDGRLSDATGSSRWTPRGVDRARRAATERHGP